MSLRITEIFSSIQGETTYAGLPTTFVRLTGCPLRCIYCDTEYAFHEGDKRTIDQVIAQCDELTAASDAPRAGCDLYEVTGGEPLLQRGVHPLMTALCDRGKTVLIETSGACDIGVCDPRVVRIMDLKSPGSGEVDRNDWNNLDKLTPRDEIKFVLTDRADYDWMVEILDRHRLHERVNAVLVSAVNEVTPGLEIAGVPGLAVRDLAEWILADRLPVRFQTQLHKLVWDPMARGV
ncbi:MAG: radical SAM protein [Phycisphaeraceae bacterium]